MVGEVAQELCLCKFLQYSFATTVSPLMDATALTRQHIIASSRSKSRLFCLSLTHQLTHYRVIKVSFGVF
jgi:hypothetical protein